jgi:hypothetical protein
VPTTNLFATILRFAFGLSGGVGLSFLLFRQAIFDPRSPVFECLTASVVLAAILALLRSDRQTQAGALVVALALLRLGFAQSQGWTVALAGVLLTGGFYLIALIFDLLARRGVLFGKFLVVGPLLGGVYLATTPLASFFTVTGSDVMPYLMRHVFLGLMVGDAVGLGAEVADMWILVRAVRQSRTEGDGRTGSGGSTE